VSYADDCTRVYTRRGASAHLIPPADPDLSTAVVLCPLRLKLGESWLGTGSQDERDHAASLPVCKWCASEAAADDARRARVRQP
jgi:hypothetical protein